jgi:hypothetical protein
MNIRPIATPGAATPTPQASPTATAHQAKARAIEAFNKASEAPAPTQGQQQEHPVVDPNQVSVEELTAIQGQPAQPAIDKQAEEKEEKTEDPALSRQFAQLAKQERLLRQKVQQQEQAIKAREAALAAKEAELTAKAQEYETGYIPKSRLLEDTLGTLEAEGLSYDSLTQQALARQPVDPQVKATISRLEAKIAQLEKASETSQKSYQQQQQDQYQAALRQIELDATSLVKSDPVAYEAISKTGTVKEVVKLIKDTYDKDGVLLTVEEAAQEVENYLVEENYNMASKIDKIKKRMSQANASQAATNQAQARPATPQQTQTQMKTLTNAASSSRKLSARERALLAFKGELKG